VLAISGLLLRPILRRAFRPAFGKHRLVGDETAVCGGGRRRDEMKSKSESKKGR
jgi:hypothetical protein